MKLQLDEKTLNAYINAALNEEIDELFGSRVNKQSKRMITGKGWGNQKREKANLWGDANTAIDTNSDAESQTPQTLVGMIVKMEQALNNIESFAGIQSNAESSSDAIKNAGNLKKTLLAAINALTQIARRVNRIERMSGSNSIMENTGRDATGYGVDAAVGGNAVAGNVHNMRDLTNLQKTHGINTSFETNVLHNAQYTNKGYGIGNKVDPKKAADLVKTGKAKYLDTAKTKIGYVGKNGNITTTKMVMTQDDVARIANMAAAQGRNATSTELSRAALDAKHINMGTGFWGKQAANFKNAADTMKGAREYGRLTTTLARNAGKGKTAANLAGAAKTFGQFAKATGQMAQLPMLLLSIADEAARQAAQGRQRNVVRTYNAAAIIAKRLANISQEIANAQGGEQAQAGRQEGEEVIQEINVHRGVKSFDSIERGMEELSELMRQIGGGAGSLGTMNNRVIEIPQGLDLNTSDGVLAFQQWLNSIPITDANGNALREDGIFGTNTNYAYDKVAQMIQQQQQGNTGTIREGVIKESKAIETALANLERAAGTTGSGGNAYSAIGAMSGGAGASRLQNAQNIKNIIRTYPPVLNQYLNILSDSGADVSTLQPLNVDTRPHRNYSVKEIRAIDARIKELLQIARTVEIPEGESSEGSIIIKGTLPPKPVRKPNPSPVGPKEPDENTGNTTNRETTPLGVSGGNNLTGNAETDSGNELVGERPGLTLPQSAMRTMAQTAQSTMPLRDRQSLNRRTTRNTLDALNTMRDNGAPRSQIRNDKRAVRDARRTINRGQPISEQQFKDMVKEILKETLNK